MKYGIFSVSLMFSIMSIVGCGGGGSSSNNGNTGGGSGGGPGDVTLTASGAVTGQFSGMMDFHYMEFDDVGVEGARWELSGHDSGADGGQSFSLTMAIESFVDGGESIGRPPVGDYDIGFEPNSDEVFSAIFTHIGEGGFMDTTEYASDMDSYTGTLTITESTADSVTGHFVADLFWEDYCTADGCVGDSININGSFTAQDRIQ